MYMYYFDIYTYMMYIIYVIYIYIHISDKYDLLVKIHDMI